MKYIFRHSFIFKDQKDYQTYKNIILFTRKQSSEAGFIFLGYVSPNLLLFILYTLMKPASLSNDCHCKQIYTSWTSGKSMYHVFNRAEEVMQVQL